MTPPHHARSGSAIAALTNMDAWETDLNLRLWCDGPHGQAQARHAYHNLLPDTEADRAWYMFETLVIKIVGTANHPLVRHALGCNCVGSDECVFVHLIRTASDGHLNDAALIATVLTGAEHIAILAGEVGSIARTFHAKRNSQSPAAAPNVVRLH
ncbi:hypothetical protein [uncultured Tateyamaria sp.]|uniref:hypothetical protein n=1 Tax=uncultured Tateyamaria sp. TaxID=455651 RepID=UPI002625C3B0|nr:hypothetical protein [uncultured Tateyamaria sp.]